jgi:hypothetical protein
MSLQFLFLAALLTGNVLLRFFTNSLGVVPRIFNIWDIVVTLALAALAVGMPKPDNVPVNTRKILLLLTAFNVVCALGTVFNFSHVYWLAALSQMIMWNEPILLFLAVVSLPFTLSDIARFQRLLLMLVLLEIVVGLVQAPFAIIHHSSEEIIGTFRGNAEQYQYVILIAVFYLLAQLELLPTRKMFRRAAVFAVLVLVILIDNKASWIALAITLAILVPRFPALRTEVSGRLKSYALVAVLLVFGYSVVKLTSDTAGSKFGKLADAIESGNLLNLGKVKALRDVLRAYVSYPQMALIGSGCGTFYSRAAFQFFPFHLKEVYQNEVSVGSGEFVAGSASMAGVIDPVRGTKAFYKQFFKYEKIYAVGSGTADFPTSSYIALLGETGLVGTILYLSIYAIGLRAARDHLGMLADEEAVFPFAAASFACLVYLVIMGCYNFWLDCGRVNTIVWSMMGLTTRYVMLRNEECGRHRTRKRRWRRTGRYVAPPSRGMATTGGAAA